MNMPQNYVEVMTFLKFTKMYPVSFYYHPALSGIKKLWCGTKLQVLLIVLFIANTPVISQVDTAKNLDEITIRAFEQSKNATTAIIKTILIANADRYNKTSLVHALNNISGVRMEERSPGSYRINIRGSSLRAPFGVRNVKVYWNNIPLTDPGGNTYFNQLAYNNFSTIHIFKGPASSMYGAGTGGLIIIDNAFQPKKPANLEYVAGSYGLQNLLLTANLPSKNFDNKLTISHNNSNGYRQQSAMRRSNFSWSANFNLTPSQELNASILFTDMYYQTPGGLTKQEFETNPKNARPAVGGLPSAIDAKAAIFQKNILGGITYKNKFSSVISNTTTLYGAYTTIKNSAIRNYENRDEPHFGGRSVLTIDAPLGNNHLQWSSGIEMQQGYFKVKVRGNKNGNPDTLQTDDDININTYNIFTQITYAIADSWFYTAGAGFNKTRLVFRRFNNNPEVAQPVYLDNELSPRASILKKFDNNFSLLATISKGFSPPTLAELLPSNSIINTSLQAEQGWNYEFTVKKYFSRAKIDVEATGYYFGLQNALVQRRDESGADYFVNAGNTAQKGLELYLGYTLLPGSMLWLDYLYIRTAYALSDFKYRNFTRNTTNFSGNTLPGIPKNTCSIIADAQLKSGWYINTTLYTASAIFLNDGNTDFAKPYQLLGARAGKNIPLKKIHLNLYAGIDNALNQTYSLGNDINATGGRYYNAAPKRNFYVGAAFQYIKRN